MAGSSPRRHAKPGPDLKVLYTTGYARNAIIHHGRLDPGVELMIKPFTFASFSLQDPSDAVAVMSLERRPTGLNLGFGAGAFGDQAVMLGAAVFCEIEYGPPQIFAEIEIEVGSDDLVILG